MTTLAASAVLKLALDAGFARPHANVMVTVAWYESRWNPDATGDLTLSHFGSVGLWQIYTGVHTPAEVKVGTGAWTQALVDDLKDPAANARAAHIVFQEQGYQAWSTYNTYAKTAAFQALVARVAALPDPTAPAPVTPVAPAPAPEPTVTITLVEAAPGVWSVKA